MVYSVFLLYSTQCAHDRHVAEGVTGDKHIIHLMSISLEEVAQLSGGFEACVFWLLARILRSPYSL